MIEFLYRLFVIFCLAIPVCLAAAAIIILMMADHEDI